MESVTELVFFFPCTLMGTVLHVMEPGVKVRENKGSCWPQTLQKADVVKQHDLERIQEPDRGWVLCTLMCPGLLFWFFVFCACKQLCSRFLETGVCADTVYKIILTFKYKYIVFQSNKYTVTHQGNYPRPQVDSCVCWSSLALSLFCSLSLLQSERANWYSSPSTVLLLGFILPRAKWLMTLMTQEEKISSTETELIKRGCCRSVGHTLTCQCVWTGPALSSERSSVGEKSAKSSHQTSDPERGWQFSYSWFLVVLI